MTTPKDAYSALLLGCLSKNYGREYEQIKQYIMADREAELLQQGKLVEEDLKILSEAKTYRASISQKFENNRAIYDSIYDLLLVEGWATNYQGSEGQAFRGHFNADWPLIPTLFRNTEVIHDNLNHTISAAKIFLQPDSPVNHLSALETLAVLQHYGFPTFLLDFTTDIRIAAAFACREYQQGKNISTGVIVMLSKPDFEEFATKPHTPLGSRSVLTLDEIPRIRHQKGIFFHSYDLDMFEILTGTTRRYFRHGPDSETFPHTLNLADDILFPVDDQIDQYISASTSSPISELVELSEQAAEVYRHICDLLETSINEASLSSKPQDYIRLAKYWVNWEDLSAEDKFEIEVLTQWFIKIQSITGLPKDCTSFRRLKHGVENIAFHHDRAEQATDIFARLKMHLRPGLAVRLTSLFQDVRKEISRYR